MEWPKYTARVCQLMKNAYKIQIVTINASGHILHTSLSSSGVQLDLGVRPESDGGQKL